jgi:serine/threonine protein kinase
MNQQEFFERYRYDPNTDYLGGGGFGDVYKAYDSFKEKYVAIKEAKVSPKHKFSLKRKVELANEIEPHENIAFYQNVYRYQLGRMEIDYAIMKFYEHGDLDHLIRSGKLANDDKHDICLGILNGIAHLHEEKIIHRDLKPGNILMDLRGGKWVPKIADFGLSRISHGDQSVANSSIGKTPLYTAPEIVRGGKILPNIDIWAAGVILYKLFLGKVPFNSNNPGNEDTETGRIEIYRKIKEADIPSEIERIQEPYKTIIKECLIKNNKQRISSVSNLISMMNKGDVNSYSSGRATSDEYTQPYEEDYKKVRNEQSIISCPKCGNRMRIPNNKRIKFKCNACQLDLEANDGIAGITVIDAEIENKYSKEPKISLNQEAEIKISPFLGFVFGALDFIAWLFIIGPPAAWVVNYFELLPYEAFSLVIVKFWPGTIVALIYKAYMDWF